MKYWPNLQHIFVKRQKKANCIKVRFAIWTWFSLWKHHCSPCAFVSLWTDKHLCTATPGNCMKPANQIGACHFETTVVIFWICIRHYVGVPPQAVTNNAVTALCSFWRLSGCFQRSLLECPTASDLRALVVSPKG